MASCSNGKTRLRGEYKNTKRGVGGRGQKDVEKHIVAYRKDL
jgi:hypothetical protein